MLAAAAVHTAGINWASVLTIIGSIVACMSVVFAAIARLVTSAITTAIDKFRIEVVAKMESRLAILETLVTGLVHNNSRKGKK